LISLPQYDLHAVQRARRHGIEEYQIAEAWIYGIIEPSTAQPGCWRCIGAEVTLVLSADKSFIITLYPNKHKDRRKAERSANLMSIGATRFDPDAEEG
jgi:hypothetical protein